MLMSIRSINDNVIQQLGNLQTDKIFQEHTDNDTPKSWHKRVANEADNWMIQEVRSPECRQLLAEAIRKGNAIGVSDGSCCPHTRKGSSAVVIQCQTTGQRLLAVNLAPGHPRNQSSHLSKLTGILAIMKLLQMLHEEHNLTNGSFTFGLDNKEASLAVMSQDGPKVSKVDYDMIIDIRKRKDTIPITFNSKWTEGHQDDTNKDYSTMDVWTLLNIEMDAHAGECYQLHKAKECPNVAMANESLAVSIDDKKLPCFDKQMLCNKVFARTGKEEKDKSTWTCKDFWKERENIPEEAMDHMHWEALKKALTNSPQGTQRWILKHSTGQCGVGRMLQRWNYQEHSMCPRCGEQDKTTKHAIQCQAVDTRQRWITGTKAIRQWFITTSTNPDLQHAIFQ